MVARGQQDRITFANHLDLRWTDLIYIDKLQAKSGCRHIHISVNLLEHYGVFMRWPTSPVARQRPRNPNDEPASLDIAAQQNINLAPGAVRPGNQAQLLVGSHSLRCNKLQRILAIDGRRTFQQIDFQLCPDGHYGALWDIQSIVAFHGEGLTTHVDDAGAAQTEQSCL